jgi:hypothetical protein
VVYKKTGTIYKKSFLTYNEIFPYQQAGNFNFTAYITLIYPYIPLYTTLYTGYISVWTHTDGRREVGIIASGPFGVCVFF